MTSGADEEGLGIRPLLFYDMELMTLDWKVFRDYVAKNLQTYGHIGLRVKPIYFFFQFSEFAAKS